MKYMDGGMPIFYTNRTERESEPQAEKNPQMSLARAVETSEQNALSATVSCLKSIRLIELMDQMRSIDFRKESAMNELEKLTRSVEELISTNRGGDKGIHGFIGERAQVFLSNARSILKDGTKICELIDDNGMTDYLERGVPIQQKACRSNGWLGIDHILKHREKYPEFAGKYQIPKDFYQEFERIGKMSQSEAGRLTRHEWNLWLEIQKIKQAGITVEPMRLTYNEIQRDRIFDTIENQRDEIESEAVGQMKMAVEAHKPTVTACVQTAAVSAGVEGILSGVSTTVGKRLSGKHFKDFDKQDKKDIGKAVVEGSVKGAVRGTVVYLTENFTNVPGAAAGAAVTVAFDATKRVKECSDGKITKQECVRDIGKSALTATAGAFGAKLGGKLCPIPIVGEAVGGFIFSLAADKGFNWVVKRTGTALKGAVPKVA